jgi:hypothetical protein
VGIRKLYYIRKPGSFENRTKPEKKKIQNQMNSSGFRMVETSLDRYKEKNHNKYFIRDKTV